MRRLFWVALGGSLGALIFRKVSRAAERLTPRGIADGIGAGLTELSYALRDFSTDVREAMTHRESELRQAAGLDAGVEIDQDRSR